MVNRDFEPGGPAKFQVKDLVNALRAAERLGFRPSHHQALASAF